MKSIPVTAWNNGSHHKSGAGYGVKINSADRDLYFQRDWKTISLQLEGLSKIIQVNIDKESFWGTTCRELISIEIGRWLINSSLAPWVKGIPPKLYLDHIESNHFVLRK